MSRLLCSLLVILFFFLSLSCKKKELDPPETLKEFSHSIKEKDWAKVWESISAKSKEDFVIHFQRPFKEKVISGSPKVTKKVIPELGKSPEEIARMPATELFIFIMEKSEADKKLLEKFDPEKLNVEQVIIDNDVAKIMLKGQQEPICLIKEGNVWKIDLN